LLLIAEVGASTIGLTKAEEKYDALLDQGDEAEFDPEELIYVGDALGGGVKLVKNFLPINTKRSRRGLIKTSGKKLSLNNMIGWRRTKFGDKYPRRMFPNIPRLCLPHGQCRRSPIELTAQD
jgi:hypothetical protein